MNDPVLAFSTLNISNKMTVLNGDSRPEVESQLIEIKALAKINFRLMSKKYHPDNIKSGNRTKFEMVKESHELIKTLKIIPNPYFSIKMIGIGITPGGVSLAQNNKWNFAI